MNISGPFTIHLKEVYIEGMSNLGVERDGKFRTQDVNIDITFKEMNMDFKNLGFFASIFQGVANSASNVVSIHCLSKVVCVLIEALLDF